MLSETQRKGEIAFLQIALRALERGAVLSRPSVDARYDAVLDTGDELLRAQVKYCGGTSSKLEVHLVRKSQSKRGFKKPRCYKDSEVDVLLVYSPHTGKCYALPPELWHDKTIITLRLAAPKNNQSRGVKLARAYEW